MSPHRPDHKNSPHYRLEIKCEGRERELAQTDCLGKYFLDKREREREVFYCMVWPGGVWPPSTEDILLSGAQFYKMLHHCSGDLKTLVENLIVILLLTKVAMIMSIFISRLIKKYSEMRPCVRFLLRCVDNFNSQDLK